MSSREGEGPPPDPDAFGDGGEDGDEIYLPFAGRRAHTSPGEQLRDDDEGDDDALLFDDDVDELDPASAVRMRPPPRELSRRDRREWHRLEVARINRAAQSVASRRRHPASASWSGGFIQNPPRGLGRKGRKAWLAAEQEATTQWWAQRRASDRDIDARMAGAAVLALVIGIAVVAALVVHRSAPAAATTGAPPAVAATTATPAATLSAAPVASAPVVPGATGSVRVATGNPAVGVTPTVAPPVSGRWQPTPAGGVPPITPTTPATVPLLAAVTGPVTATEQGSARAVVTSWLARTCPSSWRDPFGTDLLRGKALETAAGWKVDDPGRDTVGAALWRSVAVAHRQTRRCGNLVVTVSPDQPLTAHGGFVLYSADRVVTSADGQLPATVEHLSGARRVVADGGKWFVDIPVVGG